MRAPLATRFFRSEMPFWMIFFASTAPGHGLWDRYHSCGTTDGLGSCGMLVWTRFDSFGIPAGPNKFGSHPKSPWDGRERLSGCKLSRPSRSFPSIQERCPTDPQPDCIRTPLRERQTRKCTAPEIDTMTSGGDGGVAGFPCAGGGAVPRGAFALPRIGRVRRHHLRC
jgi:hypothetical protein